MKSVFFCTVISALALSLSLSNCPAQGTTIASPLVGGNSGNIYPFGIGVGQTMRYQQVFGASDFLTRLPEGGWITAFRFDLDPVNGVGFSTTLPGLQINLSTTLKAVDGLSSLFAENVGLNDTMVFGPSSIHLQDGSAGGYNIVIPLSNPFFYDPNMGNLLMDVRNFGGGETSFFNANYSPNDTTSRVFAESSVDALSGFVDTRGLVTVFNVVAVPEPGLPVLLGLAGALWWGARRWRKGA